MNNTNSDHLRDSRILELIIGKSQYLTIEQRCLNAVVFSSTAITTFIFLQSIFLRLPIDTLLFLFLFSFLFGVLFFFCKTSKDNTNLIWAYLFVVFIILLIDWLLISGFSGMALPATVAVTGMLPILMKSKQLIYGFLAVAVFFSILSVIPLTIPQVLPQPEMTTTHMVDLLANTMILASGVALLTFIVMKTSRNQRYQLNYSNQKFEELNRELRHRNNELKTAYKESHKITKKLDQSLAEQRSISHLLDESHKFLDTLFDTIPIPVFYKDSNLKFKHVNTSFCSSVGLKRNQIIDHTAEEFRSDETLGKSRKYDLKILDAGEIHQYETSMRFDDGLLHHVLVSKNAHYDHNNTVVGIVGTITDITERKIHETKIQYLAHHDALTGLHNRNYFYEELTKATSKALRNNRVLNLLAIDLDGFKQINDTYGHHAGDVTLKEIGGRLKESTRDYDTVCRLGGDEFSIILEGIEGQDNVITVVKKILSATSTPISNKTETYALSASIGIAQYPSDTTSRDEFVKLADKAMYESKNKGKNQYCFYSTLNK